MKFSDRAVVVGGGIAGLVTARVLSDYFSSVVILDKDKKAGSPGPRSGVPQGPHLHVLLQRGQGILRTLFPGIESAFNVHLCPTIDWSAFAKREIQYSRSSS